MCVLILLLIRSEIAHELVIELFCLSVHELAIKYFNCCFYVCHARGNEI
jgi:hypothetical protein